MKDLNRIAAVITLLLGFMINGAVAVAWGYSNFVSKDSFSLIIDRLNRIETKLDSALDRR